SATVTAWAVPAPALLYVRRYCSTSPTAPAMSVAYPGVAGSSAAAADSPRSRSSLATDESGPVASADEVIGVFSALVVTWATLWMVKALVAVTSTLKVPATTVLPLATLGLVRVMVPGTVWSSQVQ